GIAFWLKEIPEVVILGEVKTAAEILYHPALRKANLIIMELGPHGRTGLETLQSLPSRAPKVPVLIFSFHPEEVFGLRALKAGAAGYVSKQGSMEEFLRAVKQIAGGQRYVPPCLTSILLHDWNPEHSMPAHESLSAREYQIMKMVASGSSLKSIAVSL